MADIEDRVVSLERWKAEQVTARAVDDERRKHMDARFDRLDQGLIDQKKDFKEFVDENRAESRKFFWLIIALIIGGIGQFIINGGLTLAP